MPPFQAAPLGIKRHQSLSFMTTSKSTMTPNIRRTKSLDDITDYKACLPRIAKTAMDRVKASINLLRDMKSEMKAKSQRREEGIKAIMALGCFVSVIALVVICGLTGGLGAGAIVLGVFSSFSGVQAGMSRVGKSISHFLPKGLSNVLSQTKSFLLNTLFKGLINARARDRKALQEIDERIEKLEQEKNILQQQNDMIEKAHIESQKNSAAQEQKISPQSLRDKCSRTGPRKI